jgi:hypothetical protein
MILDELHTYFNSWPGLEDLVIYKPILEDGDGVPDFQMAIRPTGGAPRVRTLDDNHGTVVDPITIQHILRSNPVGSEANTSSAYQDAFNKISLVYDAVDAITVRRRILSNVVYEYAEALQRPTPFSEADENDRWLFSFNAVYYRERP